jgi:hypothetical protein
MKPRVQSWLLGAFAVTGILLMTSRAHAQFGGPINPYAPGSFPLNPLNPVNPYQPGQFPGTPYSSAPFYGDAGGLLFGQGDVLRAYGMAITSQEQARILRQQSIQARLDTQRKRFELEMYIKANTPSFTEEQAKIARTTLRRIQTNSTPAEISTGKSLNLMLDDARRFSTRKVSVDNLALSEDVLLQLNVTSSEFGLGALRSGGKIAWPIGLQEIMSPELRKTLDTQAQALVQGASKGKIDVNIFRDFSNELDRTAELLVKKVNDVGPHYLEAKRFLSDLQDARKALEKGEAQHQIQYMKWVSAGGGKSVQDVVDYLISKGLRFAPATTQDEAAYRAFFSAFVVYDVALNAQYGNGEGKESTPTP